jgi:hypothetical protein
LDCQKPRPEQDEHQSNRDVCSGLMSHCQDLPS